MYCTAFYENNGIYILMVDLLKLEVYDNKGRLNELHITLDKINNRYSDYCTVYVAGMHKKQNGD